MKRTRGRLDKYIALCSKHIQESVSMHKRPTPVRHSCMNQARSEKDKKERKRDRKDRSQVADGKKSSQTKQKHI